MQIPGAMQNAAILLHFEAVDWQATVYLDGIQIATACDSQPVAIDNIRTCN